MKTKNKNEGKRLEVVKIFLASEASDQLIKECQMPEVYIQKFFARSLRSLA